MKPSLLTRIDALVYSTDVRKKLFFGGEGHSCDVCGKECIPECFNIRAYDVCGPCYRDGWDTKVHCTFDGCKKQALFDAGHAFYCEEDSHLVSRVKEIDADWKLTQIASEPAHEGIVLCLYEDRESAYSRDWYEDIIVPDNVLALESLPGTLSFFFPEGCFPGKWNGLINSTALGQTPDDDHDTYDPHCFAIGCIRYWLPFAHTRDAVAFVGIAASNQGKIALGRLYYGDRLSVTETSYALEDIVASDKWPALLPEATAYWGSPDDALCNL